MSTTFLDPPGLAVPGESLRLGKARAFAEHIASECCPFTKFVECFSDEHSNSVVFETEVSLPQHGSRFGVEDRERVAVVFFDPDPTTLIDPGEMPLGPGETPKYEPITCEDYIAMRMAEAFDYKD